MTRTRIAAGLVALALAGLAGCGGGGTGAAGDGPGGDGPGGDGATLPTASGTITVFAAASLTESFTRLGNGFMQENPSATVTFSFGGSSALAAQINQGAPA